MTTTTTTTTATTATTATATVTTDPARYRGTARGAGLGPALAELCAATLPGLLPCGPAGHAVVPAGIAHSADRVWRDGLVSDRAAGTETTLATVDLPGGPLILVRHRPAPGTAGTDDAVTEAWRRGLVWVRLGLSEGLLDTCVRYLGDRGTGESTLLRRQLVQGAVADVLIEQLEVRAVLTGAGPLTGARLTHLHDRLTQADRTALRLLGAAGFLTGGPGQVAHHSELLAEAHRQEEPG